jgi:ADP-heptose:LPS heptosyltransferase
MKLPTGLMHFALCYISPYVCIFGGYPKERTPTNKCWRYNVTKGVTAKWEALPSLPHAAYGLSCVVID